MHITRSASLGLALLSLGALGLAARPAQAETFTFDNVTAPALYSQVTPSATEGPTLVFPDITFTGGVILNDSDFGGEATTKPNLLATNDETFGTLADGSTLPGFITGTFTTPGEFNQIALDIAGNFTADSYTLAAFNAANTEIAESTIFLNGVPGNTGHVAVFQSGISYFTVRENTAAGSSDFGIDTVVLSGAPVPEASTTVSFGLLLALGLGGLAVAKKRKQSA